MIDLTWYSVFVKPHKPGYVLIEILDSTYYIEHIDDIETFDEWSDDIIRWTYIDNNNYTKYQNALSDLEHFKEENERLKVDLKNTTEKLENEKELNEHRIDYLKKLVEDWHNKYLDLLGEQHNEHQREAFVGTKIKREFLDDYCGGINSDGDEHLTADDLRELFKPDDARPVSEVSINELRDIFLEVMREAKERERIEEDDGK